MYSKSDLYKAALDELKRLIPEPDLNPTAHKDQNEYWFRAGRYSVIKLLQDAVKANEDKEKNEKINTAVLTKKK